MNSPLLQPEYRLFLGAVSPLTTCMCRDAFWCRSRAALAKREEGREHPGEIVRVGGIFKLDPVSADDKGIVIGMFGNRGAALCSGGPRLPPVYTRSRKKGGLQISYLCCCRGDGCRINLQATRACHLRIRILFRVIFIKHLIPVREGIDQR